MASAVDVIDVNDKTATASLTFNFISDSSIIDLENNPTEPRTTPNRNTRILKQITPSAGGIQIGFVGFTNSLEFGSSEAVVLNRRIVFRFADRSVTGRTECCNLTICP